VAVRNKEPEDSADVVAGLDRLYALLRRLVPSDGMSLTAASTLHRLDRDGPRRLTELAGMEGVTQPAMTQLVSRLERDGLAQRLADPVDGRVVLVEVTTAGVAVLRRRRDVRAQRLTELLAHLTAAERQRIVAAIAAFDRLSDLPPPT
jgi:DNA-binding MarR family transcriptional regulator